MDKEGVVHIHNGISLSYKKEHIWVSANEVDEPRAFYTELSKSEIETPYTNVYIWNLKRCYRWTFIQSSNGDADIENRLVGGMGEGKGEMDWESSFETCALLYRV